MHLDFKLIWKTRQKSRGRTSISSAVKDRLLNIVHSENAKTLLISNAFIQNSNIHKERESVFVCHEDEHMSVCVFMGSCACVGRERQRWPTSDYYCWQNIFSLCPWPTNCDTHTHTLKNTPASHSSNSPDQMRRNACVWCWNLARMWPWSTKSVIRVWNWDLYIINKSAFHWCMVCYDRTIFENLESEGAKKSKYWENHL